MLVSRNSSPGLIPPVLTFKMLWLLLGLFSLKLGLMIPFVLLDDVVEERNGSGKRTGFMFLLRF